jgi:hypothetical protein
LLKYKQIFLHTSDFMNHRFQQLPGYSQIENNFSQGSTM